MPQSASLQSLKKLDDNLHVLKMQQIEFQELQGVGGRRDEFCMFASLRMRPKQPAVGAVAPKCEPKSSKPSVAHPLVEPQA